ncbi:hypothetical protein LOD99_3477 [Oopsacas minuta]|uniref:SRCR domain-containing protein n=1 Tax=Oopsacas minuta TaxID=111878 RepID=A0AAV7JXA2_9METZ|nr:hypothetical protein LOD99_3477 [Oopsacas minuta]
MPSRSIIVLLTVCYVLQLQAGSLQEEIIFRQINNVLQISFPSQPKMGIEEWYNVSGHRFDYRGGIVACNELSNESFVDFQTKDISTDMFEDENQVSAAIYCDLPRRNNDDCFVEFVPLNDVIINLTCIDASQYNEGDILQLEDGSIVQLKSLYPGKYIWAHFCVDRNPGWDMNATNLACQKLGYHNGAEFTIGKKYKRVYGLVDIDCTGATDFLQCTSDYTRFDDGDCFQGVIAITCEGKVTTAQMQTTSNEPSYSPSSTDSTTWSSNAPTSYNTNNTQINQHMIYIITGISIVIIVLLILMIGSLLTGIAICLCKSGYCRTPVIGDIVEGTSNEGERKECDPYLRMQSYPNGDIKQVLKKDKLYYNVNEVEESTQSYQHTYLEMKPRQCEQARTKDSAKEPYYTLY